MSMLSSTTSLSLGSLTLVGRSRAGDGTSFYIPELRWMLDAGALATASPPHTLFITHTHSDHIFCLGRILHAATTAPLTVYVPAAVLPLIERHVDAYRELIECNDAQYQDFNRKSLQYTLQPVQLDQVYSITKGGGIDYIIRPLQCEHRVLCYGYSIFQTRQRLRQEYAELSGQEINELKKQGLEITEAIEEPLLCFLGDTTHAIFERYPNLPRQHNLIIVECTFIDDDNDKELARADETKHMHWNHLRPVIQAHPTTMFVLIHFSLKYSNLRLRQFFNNAQKELGLANIHPMLIQGEVEAEWRKAGQKRGNVAGRERSAPTCRCRLCCASHGGGGS